MVADVVVEAALYASYRRMSLLSCDTGSVLIDVLGRVIMLVEVVALSPPGKNQWTQCCHDAIVRMH